MKPIGQNKISHKKNTNTKRSLEFCAYFTKQEAKEMKHKRSRECIKKQEPKIGVIPWVF